jgi:TolB protein
MDVDGNNKIDISQHGTGEWRMPNWSSDGSYIVHQRYLGVGAPEIVIMDSYGNNSTRLTNDTNFDNFPKYSPDDNYILYTSQSSDGLSQIWIMNADGSNRSQLTSLQGYNGDWSPDSEWIVYTDSRMLNGKLWLMRKNGSEKKQLTYD